MAEKLSRRYGIAIYGICCAVCLCMAIALRAQDKDSRIAVLEQRANQIDTHLQSTDGNVQRLWQTQEAQGNQLSEMLGEVRAAFAFLTLLTGANFVVQVKKKP